MDILYPLVLFGALGGLAIFLCGRAIAAAERGWLTGWLTVSLVLRMGVATVFAAIPSTRMFHEDADGYEWLGMAMARGWRGEGPRMNPLAEITQNYGYKYIAAATYYVFGQFAPLVAYSNCVLGMLNVYLIYRLTRQYFHPLVARRAALMSALFPSMILWSAVAMKDTLMSVLIVVTLSGCVALKRRFSFGAMMVTAGSIVAMQPVRFYMVYFLGFSVVTSLFLERGIRQLGGVYKQLVLLGVFAGLLAIAGNAGGFSEGTASLNFESVSRFRHAMATTASSGFDSGVDVSTPQRALAFLPVGMAELLLGPFPWQFGSLRALFAAPETFYWWWMFPGLVSGLIWAVRKRFAETSPLVLFAVTMTCAYSLMHGNVGSGFRQRAQIFVILFIFASFGHLKRRAQKLGIDSDLLLDAGLRPSAGTTPAPAVSATPTALAAAQVTRSPA
jgi:hypothetical protein